MFGLNNNIEQELWLMTHGREHVDRDLEPYVCISDYCGYPFKLFTSFHDWKYHMETTHTMDWAWKTNTLIWQCSTDHAQIATELDQKEFHNKEAFIHHLSNAHGGVLSKTQILARSSRDKKWRIREPFTCPFCGYQPDEVAQLGSEKAHDLLSRHIGRHLQSLSLLSIQYLDLVDGCSEPSGSEKINGQ